MFSVAALSLALLLGGQKAEAFFRMPCHDTVVVERADPILSPGAASGHLHTIMGGNQNGNIFNMTYDTARASTCSTCAAKADLSAYWTPTLFFQDTDGKFTPVPQVGGATVYYLQRPGDNKDEPLKAFPPGFRMVAGDSKRRSFTAGDKAQEAVTHVCLDFKNTGAGGEFPEIPPHHCPEGMRTQVFFPACWNGELDSDNHKSHVSYPETGAFNGGNCPASHPIHLISIFYEIHWDTSSFADKFHAGLHGTGHPYVLSTGDPTGYGFHGDFQNGWDEKILQRAIDECTNNSGSMDDCAVLEQRTMDEMKSCKVPSQIDEPIGLDGPLDKLPGCNDVFAGPGPATPKAPSTCGAITTPGGSPGQPAPQPEPTDSEPAPEPIPTDTDTETETSTETPAETETTVSEEPSSTETPVETETETESWPEETPTSTEDVPEETSTDAPPAPPAPTTGPVTGWADLGCYVDPVNPRALSSAKTNGATMTPSYCQDWCGSRGFSYAATEHGGECFCGNELSAGAVSAESDKCDMKCEGDASFACGSSGFMNLYQLGGSSPAPVDPSVTLAPQPLPAGTGSTTSTRTHTRKPHWHHWNRRSTDGSSARRTRRSARLH